MPTLADLRAVDCLGIPRFTTQQAKAMVDMVRNRRMLESEPPECEGQGIVIAGGGRYLSHAWVLCRLLRKLGCNLPVQVWHMGTREMPGWARQEFVRLDVEPVDAHQVMKRHPVRELSGWTLKNYAIMHCPWRNVLFLDADCFPALNPEELFGVPEIRDAGGFFFSDTANHAKSSWAWVYCGLQRLPVETEMGQYFVNKETGWMGLRWTQWLNEHASDVWFKLVHGDKTTTELGFRVSGVPIVISQENEWKGWGISQQWQGRELFRHCMGAKRGEAPWPADVGPLFREWDALALGKV